MNKIMIKKSLSLLLAVIMLVPMISVMGITALAADEVTVGGVSYATLEEAISAAPNGSKVYINSDVKVKSTISVAKTITLATNGQNVEISRATGFSGEIFDVSGTLVLSPGSGSITVSGNSGATAVLVRVSGGTFTMNDSCLLTGNKNTNFGGSAVYIASGTFNFAGGEIKGNSCAGNGNAVYVANDFGTFKMSGSANFGDASSVYLKASSYIEISSALSGSSPVNVYVENAYEGRKIAALTGSFSLSEGQINRFKVSDGNDSFEVEYSDNSIFVSFEKAPENKDVCKIEDKVYDTLMQAIAAAPANESTEIVILSDIVLDGEVKINNDKKITLTTENSCVISRSSDFTSGALFSVEKGASLSLKGSLQINGASVAASNAVIVEGSFAISRGVSFANHICQNGVIAVMGGAFTMNGGTISSNTVSNGTVYVKSGFFTMKDGEIKSNTAVNGGGVYIESGSFNMAGGCIFGNSAALGNCIWAGVSVNISGYAALGSSEASPMIYLNTNAVMNFSSDWAGAELDGYSSVISVAMKEIKLNAIVAQFEAQAKAERFALDATMGTQYALKVDANKLKVVKADDAYVAFYENKGYTTLEEAFAQVPENTTATVTCVGEALMTQTIVIKKGQHISLVAGDMAEAQEEVKTQINIKRDPEFSGSMFTIEKDGALTIFAPEGKIICLDGESKEVQGSLINVNGTLSIGEGAVLANNNNKLGEVLAEKAVYSYGGGVFVGPKGVLTLAGGKIENCYASLGGAVYVKDGTFNLALGSVAKNRALNGAGVYLETTTLFEKQTLEKDETYTLAAFNMAEGEITENQAIAVQSVKNSGFGGGIFAGNGTKTVISGGKIFANTASFGGAAAIGNIPEKVEDKIDAPEFSLTQKVIVGKEKTNTIHLTYPGKSFVSVIEGLSDQKDAIVLSIPESLPANMPMVKYVPKVTEEDNKKEEKEEKVVSAKPAIEKKLFALEENAAKRYRLSISELDESLIINTTEEGVFTGYKTGRHYNAITRYKAVKETEEKEENKEEAKAEDKKEEKEQLSYKPITIGQNGIFSVYYEINYHLDSYKSITPMLTGCFEKGTKLTLIDSTDEKNVSYYYYKVTGEEKVKTKGEITETLNEDGKLLTTLDSYEIPLSDFYKMGTDSEHYKLEFSSDAKTITEKLTIVVDFTAVESDPLRTPFGEYVMALNHYVVDAKSGLTYDITEFIGHAKYTVTDESKSEVILTSNEEGITISYSISAESAVLGEKHGVVVLSLGTRFPKGTVFVDENGNQYIAAERSTLLVISLPGDSKGNIVKNGNITLTPSNYFGTEIPEASMKAYLYASNNGKQYSDYADYDAKSEAITFSLGAKDKNGILVTVAGGEEKPYYDGNEELAELEFINVDVKAVTNGNDADKFRLFLQKKQKDGSYKNCALSELFIINDASVKMVELSTGEIKLELRKDIDKFIGSEFKIGFKHGDVVEYVKVNNTK